MTIKRESFGLPCALVLAAMLASCNSASPESDAGIVHPDAGGQSTVDSSMPISPPDAALAGEDASTALDAGAGAGLDASIGLDAGAAAGMDASAGLDAATASADASAGLDAAINYLDASTGLDAAAPGPNQVDLIDNAGNVLNTYLTIGACAKVVAAGQKCLVHPGTYDERVIPPSSGTAGSPITFQASGAVKVKGFSIKGQSYITIDGFEITHAGLTGESGPPNYITPGSSDSASVFLNPASNVQIRNNTIHDTEGGCILFYETPATPCNHVLVKGNTISHCGNQAGATWTAATGISMYGDYNRVEGNDVSHIGEDFMRMTGGQFNVVRNNTLHDNSHADGQAGDVTHIDGLQNWCTAGGLTTHWLLIENNTLANAPSPDTHFTIFQDEGDCGESDVIIRYNTVSDVGESFIVDDQRVQNVRIYNNTAYNLGRAALVTGEHNWEDVSFTDYYKTGKGATGGRSINNIFYNTVYHPGPGSGGNENTKDALSTPGFYADYNLAYDSSCTTTCSWNNPVPGIGQEPDSVINQDPLFTALATNDFSLQDKSPAIDKGGPITHAAAADTGSGAALVVDDAGFFQDGWTGVDPDWVAIGSTGNVSQIASIDYTTNTITLTTAVARTAGAPVWLYKNSNGTQVLYGSGPDIGAHEHP
jgi:hypothetical protein